MRKEATHNSRKSRKMELLKESKMPDGRSLRIYRQITPAKEAVPERLIRYLISSIGFDSYRKFIHDQNYWRLYYRAAFDGEGAVDHLYLAEVDGTFAARVWFAYSPASGFGNFGNVYTEPAFRRLGLMSELMHYCVRDFLDSPAKLLCCGTGNVFAAASYRKFGFQMTYGGETGMMHLINPKYGSHFRDLEKVCFDGSPIVKVRPGTPGDQFDCDKFLVHTAAMRGKARGSAGPDAYVSEYRVAWQDQKNGTAVTAVAENANGTVTAYAYAVKAFGRNCLNFTVYPDNTGEVKELLTFTAAEFRKLFPGEPILIYVGSNCALQLEALEKADFKPIAQVPGSAPGIDLLIFEI